MHEMTNFFTSPHTLISRSKTKYVKVKWMWISANYWSKEKTQKTPNWKLLVRRVGPILSQLWKRRHKKFLDSENGNKRFVYFLAYVLQLIQIQLASYINMQRLFLLHLSFMFGIMCIHVTKLSDILLRHFRIEVCCIIMAGNLC